MQSNGLKLKVAKMDVRLSEVLNPAESKYLQEALSTAALTSLLRDTDVATLIGATREEVRLLMMKADDPDALWSPNDMYIARVTASCMSDSAFTPDKHWSKFFSCARDEFDCIVDKMISFKFPK